MNDLKKSDNVFDDLLEGDTPPDVFQTSLVSEAAKEDLQRGRDVTRRAAAHVRERGLHAARHAHERAQGMAAAARRELPGQIDNARGAVAAAAQSIRQRSLARPWVGGTVIVVVCAMGAYLNAERLHISAASSVNLSPATRPANAPVPIQSAQSPVSANADPASRFGVPTPPASLTRPSVPSAISVGPSAAAIPPVPTDSNAGTCALGLPTINALYSSNRTHSPEEEGWIRFGYDCLGRGLLTVAGAGFGMPVQVKPSVLAPGAGSGRTGRTSVGGETQRARSASALAKKTALTHVAPSAPVRDEAISVLPVASAPAAPATCVLRGSATTSDGDPMQDAPVRFDGLSGTPFASTVRTDSAGHFSVEGISSSGRVRVTLRARGFLDDVRESANCAPVALRGKKSNPLSSLFDAARRADRSIQGTTGRP